MKLKDDTVKKIDIFGKYFFAACFACFSFIGANLYNKIDKLVTDNQDNSSNIVRVEQKLDLKTDFINKDIAYLYSKVDPAKHEEEITINKNKNY